MTDNNKYYVPDIEDLHIGYEFELICHNGDWKSGIFPNLLKENKDLDEFKNDDLMKLAHAIIRTKYLDKEDIESLEWKCTDDTMILKSLFFAKISIFIQYQMKYNLETRNMSIINENARELYTGECKSINELKYIMKLLGIIK